MKRSFGMFDRIVRPFIPYSAFSWLEENLKKDMKVFEYGSGMSTVWFGQKVKSVVSVEDSDMWFNEVKLELNKHNITNVNYVHRKNGPEYSSLINEFEGLFDVVFVDGKFRRECMEACFDKARYFIMLDNSDAHHYLDAYEVMCGYGCEIVEFYDYGLNPYTGKDLPDKWKASVLIKNV